MMKNRDWLEVCFRLMDEAKADSLGKNWKREELYERITVFDPDKQSEEKRL